MGTQQYRSASLAGVRQMCHTTAGPKTFLCVPPCPAGSGKTTLLAIVAGSAEDLDKRSVLTGSVLMDGQPIHSAQRRKVGLWNAAQSKDGACYSAYSVGSLTSHACMYCSSPAS